MQFRLVRHGVRVRYCVSRVVVMRNKSIVQLRAGGKQLLTSAYADKYNRTDLKKQLWRNSL